MSEERTEFFNCSNLYERLVARVAKSASDFEKQWNPKLGLEVDVLNEKLNDTLYEVILKLGVTVKTDDEVAFLVEIQQAGVFVLQGFDEQTIEHILGSMCPNILFPYARETIDSLAVKATFPAPMLAPINFDAFMEQRKKPETN